MTEATKPGRRTIVYVDGYNLYVGALEHTTRKWLDLPRFFRFVRSDDEIVQVRYFTSLHIKSTDTAGRQEMYLRALRTLAPALTVHLGRQKHSGVVCGVPKNVCSVSRKQRFFHKREEKQVDVALAAHMVFDVATGRCDQVVLVSGDSDYIPALRLLRHEFPTVRRVVYVPSRDGKRYPSKALREAADECRVLPEAGLPKCQLPEVLTDEKGEIRRPLSWAASATLVASTPTTTAPSDTMTARAAPPVIADTDSG